MNLKRGWRSKARKFLPGNLVAAVDAARSDDVLFIDWVNRGPVTTNWGDAVAPVLAERLSGKRVVNQRVVLNLRGKTIYTTIGSMIGTVEVPGFEVWGSGFVTTNAQLKVRPGKIHAVRGPLTRQKLIDAGVDCPEVFGDPALLTPRFWNRSPEVTHRIGIIPHFKDTHLPSAQRFAGMDDVMLIDIRAGLDEVVAQVTSCGSIASGSLHGLVLADSFGIPTTWVEFSDAAAGDGFKFRDYLESCGGRDLAPLPVDAKTELAAIEERIRPTRVDVDLDQFLHACPFLAPGT